MGLTNTTVAALLYTCKARASLCIVLVSDSPSNSNNDGDGFYTAIRACYIDDQHNLAANLGVPNACAIPFGMCRAAIEDSRLKILPWLPPFIDMQGIPDGLIRQ